MTRLENLSRAIRPWTLTALRVVVGVVMAAHGWAKLTDYGSWLSNLDAMGMPYPEIAAPLAVTAELVGGVALAIGALTPVAAGGVLSTMLVAIFLLHLPNGLFAKDGGFEYPLVMAAAALFFMTRGAGRFSVDSAILRWRRPQDDMTPVRRPTEATA